jgi:chromosome segregation ATPase
MKKQLENIMTALQKMHTKRQELKTRLQEIQAELARLEAAMVPLKQAYDSIQSLCGSEPQRETVVKSKNGYKKPIFQKICIDCGKAFEANSQWRKYCGDCRS